jgi:5-methylcytosine-specific restriction endonuclease McrA
MFIAIMYDRSEMRNTTMSIVMPILALDQAGNPSRWINQEKAVHLIVTDRVLAPLGEESRIIRGGVNAQTGLQSCVEDSSILLTRSKVQPHLWAESYEPPLTNRALFARDRYLCLYCGKSYSSRELTRDHVIPRSRGGSDRWSNVVSCCHRCNHLKGARTPDEWGVELLAVPYAPCYAEHLILRGKNILTDQATFLRARVRRS